MEHLFLILTASILILAGLFGVLAKSHLIKLLLALNLLEIGINLVLVFIGHSLGSNTFDPGGQQAEGTLGSSFDPLTQDMALISILIGFAATVLALAAVLKHARRRKTLNLDAWTVEEE